ncbi:hypothetical protein HK405_012020 [Cladochytrium tenue]|nr:hypothetical protein HK405_012020 [Cladochytrium tenue]
MPPSVEESPIAAEGAAADGTAVPAGAPLPRDPVFPYSTLMKRFPDLSTAQLINANNYDLSDVLAGKVDPRAPPVIPTDADAVVVGAGMAGLVYALELKCARPEATIVVLEKSTEPKYKIGESTLSPFSRFCFSRVLPVPYMLRLFGLKEGLDFALVDRDGGEVHYQDIGGLDYSFQLERQVSELLFTMKAQQIGVKVFYGVSVVPEKSTISSSAMSKTVGFSMSSAVAAPAPVSPLHIDAKKPASVDVSRSPRAYHHDSENPVAKWWHNTMSHLHVPKPESAKGLGRSMSARTSKSPEPSEGNPLSRKLSVKKPKAYGSVSSARSASYDYKAPVKISTKTAAAEHSEVISAKVVADASGLTRALVAKESKAQKFDGMDFHSYWAYFEEDMFKPEERIRDWLYPATNHICYNEGWSWWIRLLSWNQTPLANLMDYINYLFVLQSHNVKSRDLPTIAKLAKTFNCVYKPIVSVGFVVRTETMDTFPPAPYVDAKSTLDGEQKFWAIVHAYPDAERVLRDSGRYTILRKYYGPARGTYFTRRNMAYYQDTVAGDGWYGLGISVGFTSPLFSPGINMICIPTGFLAATLTARQLGGGDDAAREAKQDFVKFVSKHVQDLRDVDILLYNMFRHPRFFDAIFPLFYVNGLADVGKYSEDFQPREIYWANGAGEATWPTLTAELFPLIQQAELTEELIAKVEEVCARQTADIKDRYRGATKYSSYMRYYDDDLNYLSEKGYRANAEFPAIRCTECIHANALRYSSKCIMCGAVLPKHKGALNDFDDC